MDQMREQATVFSVCFDDVNQTVVQRTATKTTELHCHKPITARFDLQLDFISVFEHDVHLGLVYFQPRNIIMVTNTVLSNASSTDSALSI